MYKRAFPTFIFCIIFFISNLYGAQVKLAWDEVESKVDFDGYTIYMRAENENYDFTQPVWVGIETQCTISDLPDDTAFFFIARTYRDEDESADSNEVCNYKPVLLSPENSATKTTALPTFTTEILPDPGYETIHATTRWQISTSYEFPADLLILDLKTDEHLYSLTLNDISLDIGMTYYWRVKHYDHVKSESPWSEIFTFSTHSENASNDIDPFRKKSGGGGGCFVDSLNDFKYF